MAQTKSTLAEVLNEINVDEALEIGESTCKIPAAMKSVALEATGGNLIKKCNNLDRAFLLVENSTAGAKFIKISAGANPPAIRKGLGVYEFECLEKTLVIIPLESARHLSAEGDLVMTTTAAMTGKIALVTLKKG